MKFYVFSMKNQTMCVGFYHKTEVLSGFGVGGKMEIHNFSFFYMISVKKIKINANEANINK